MAEKKEKMSQKDLDYFKALLQERRRQIVAAQGDVAASDTFPGQRDQGGETAGYATHLADVASDYNSLETNFDLAARDGKYLVYLEEALQRIEDGTYGICKVCHKLIPKARLEAVPTATKCVSCKSETKKREREENRLEMARIYAQQQRNSQRNDS